MMSVPESVPPGEGKEYVPVTSKVSAFATPKLDVRAHRALASTIQLSFIVPPPWGAGKVRVPQSLRRRAYDADATRREDPLAKIRPGRGQRDYEAYGKSVLTVEGQHACKLIGDR